MTDQRDEAKTEPVGGVEATQADASPGPMSRRALLRGAVIAAPTIVTMNSASAGMAMSSLSTYTSTDAPQGNNYYCLVENSTLGPPYNGNPNALQVNSASMPAVDYYGDRDYRRSDNSGAPKVSEVDMCRTSNRSGTTYYYKSQGWKPIKVKRGILLSAAAMGSLGVVPRKIDTL